MKLKPGTISIYIFMIFSRISMIVNYKQDIIVLMLGG